MTDKITENKVDSLYCRSRQLKKFEDEDLEALLDTDR